jgi:hypothetical protein
LAGGAWLCLCRQRRVGRATAGTGARARGARPPHLIGQGAGVSRGAHGRRREGGGRHHPCPPWTQGGFGDLGPDGLRGGLGSGLVRSGPELGWCEPGGLRPAKQRRPAKEMKGHGRTLVAGPRKENGLRVESVGLRPSGGVSVVWRKDQGGTGRLKWMGLAQLERRFIYFPNFIFSAKTIPGKPRNCLKARKILRKSQKIQENS